MTLRLETPVLPETVPSAASLANLPASQLSSAQSNHIHYPESDGQPMAANTKQFHYIVSIKSGFDALYKDDPNAFIAGDLLWYPVEGNNKIRQAPDVMLAYGRPKGDRNRPENATAAGTTTTAAQPQQGGGEQRRPGGPGGSTTPLAIGGGLLTVFLALELFGVTRARHGLTALIADTNTAPLTLSPAHYGGETGRAILSCLAITVVAWGVGQLIPVAHTNPPVQTAIQWDSPQTQTLAKRDCMDCHSNETVWPAYSYIAPGSWLTVLHVNDGRGELNFSELNNLPAFRKANLAQSVAEEIRSGAMPPKDYLYIHADAKLTDAEKTQLIEGFQKSLAQSLSK